MSTLMSFNGLQRLDSLKSRSVASIYEHTRYVHVQLKYGKVNHSLSPEKVFFIILSGWLVRFPHYTGVFVLLFLLPFITP